ncbi:MAG: uroporphyrinogen decarboxylase family protein [Armatimonadota bacterium]|nr:hypothetical protein [Armatimonadota bacterium]MDW8026284.1 uroporphyrinogen decarboxylase family protein [Armatimonadota bacterium]
MTPRELFIDIMHFRPQDRIPLWQVEPIFEQTIHKWCKEEGFPLGLKGHELFGFDSCLITLDLSNQLPLPAFIPKTSSSDERTVTMCNEFGFIVWCNKATAVTPRQYVYIDGPVKTRRDWEEMPRRYNPHDPRRFPSYWGDGFFEECNRSEKPIVLGMNWGPGRGIKNGYMLGFNRFMEVITDEPALLEAIFDFWADFIIQLTSSFIDRLRLDAFVFKDDGMGYKTSTMVSPTMFRRLYSPYMRRVTEFLKRHGIDIIGYYSSGNLRTLLPELLDIGINLIAPVEAAAEIDAIELRQEFPELRLIGNIARAAIMSGSVAIRAEVVRKVPLLIATGGYIPALDDAVMPDMQYADVKLCCDLIKACPVFPEQVLQKSGRAAKGIRANNSLRAAKVTPGIPRLPVEAPIYLGSRGREFSRHDNGLRPAVGVHNIGVFRACSKKSHEKDGVGATYNHQPDSAYFNGRFYLAYIGAVSEGILNPPVHTFLTWSEDGFSWMPPEILFPSCQWQGQYTQMHQRMVFFSHQSRLLATGFHGKHPYPNRGDGFARVVRETRSPSDYGPIFILRLNRGRTLADVPPYRLYIESSNSEFVAACKALLNDTLFRQQMFEEDRDPNFYVINESRGFEAKAFCFYHLPDRRIVGLWKQSYATVAEEWVPSRVPQPTRNPQRLGEHDYAKVWGQRTTDGRYALVYSLAAPASTLGIRLPLVVTTSDDGLHFDQDWLAVCGEISPQRYQFCRGNWDELHGDNKDSGPQYVCGTAEGNGTPPGEFLYVTYSMNKEDIYIAEIPLPIRGRVDEDMHDDFETNPVGARVVGWNIFNPAWCRVTVRQEAGNRFLSLSDRDPYNYAKAVRVFPECEVADLSFRVRAWQEGYGFLEIDITDRYGNVAVRLFYDSYTNQVRFRRTDPFRSMRSVKRYRANKWTTFRVLINTCKQAYQLFIDGREVKQPTETDMSLIYPVWTVERLEFRTGAYCLDDFSRTCAYGQIYYVPHNVDDPVPEAGFDIDDVHIVTFQRRWT